MSSIILVGNGFSTQEHKLGEVIDSYDTIVRFNWYQETKGKEEYLGSRTDVWCTSIFDPVRAKNNDKVFLHTESPNSRRYCKLYGQFKKHDPDFDGGHTILRLFYDIKRFISEKKNLVKTTMPPSVEDMQYSTYLLYAWWFLNKATMDGRFSSVRSCRSELLPSCNKINLIGFDWWDFGKEGYQFDDAPSLMERMDPKKELALWRLLHADGKIYDLNPESEFHHFYE